MQTSLSTAKQLLLLGYTKDSLRLWDWRILGSWLHRGRSVLVPPVVYPRMIVSNFSRGDPKEWYIEILEKFFVVEDLPLIWSSTRTNHQDTFCRSFIKVVSIPSNLDIGSYWVARSIMNHKTEVVYSVPNITRLQAYAWKIKATQKMHAILYGS